MRNPQKFYKVMIIFYSMQAQSKKSRMMIMLHQEDNATSGQTRALSASVINLPHAINVPTYQVAWVVGPVPGQQQQSIIVANEVVTRRHTFAPRRTKRCMSFDPDNPDMVCGVRGCPGANKRQNCVTPKHLYRHRDLLAINP